jgi:hypothetical protein
MGICDKGHGHAVPSEPGKACVAGEAPRLRQYVALLDPHRGGEMTGSNAHTTPTT